MNDEIRQAAIALYDRFTHGGVDRRTFMAELTRLAGGAAVASMLLGNIAAQAGAAPRIAEDDSQIVAATVTRRFNDRELTLYSARPKAADPLRTRSRSVIVIHENRGLTPHIRDVARRFALAGYWAWAPDFLTPAGGTPADEDRARDMIGRLDLAEVTSDAVALVHELRGSDRLDPVGVAGFCWGGAMVHRLALAAGDALAAGVSFYGPAPEPAVAARLESPLLLILAGRDARVNQTALPYAAAASAAGKPVRAITYPDVDHAFHNDSSAARYDADAAGRAWAETLAFFAEHLR